MRTVSPVAAARALRLSAVALAASIAVACGGNGGTAASTTTTTTTTDTTAASATTFPTGLAVASPGDVQAATVTSSAPHHNGLRLAMDWGRGVWAALADGNHAELARLATAVLPMSRAHANPAAQPDLQALADKIAKLLDGDASVDWADVLDLQDMFAGSGNATCYGPQMLYANHQDAGGGAASGQLPGGDLGLWTEYEGGTQPCVAAQLKQRTRGVKGQTMQGLLMMAAMRRTVARSTTLTMPAAGASTDLAGDFETRLHLIPAFSSVVVHAATITLDSGGGTYTYRLALANGASGAGARLGEVIMKHTPGSSASAYSGVMQVSGFTLSNDGAFGCSDAVDGGLFQVAQVSTLRYSRDGTTVAFGSRSGNYCGHPGSTSVADYGAQVAGLTSGAELDPADKLSGNVRGSSTGWRGNFARFAGSFDKDSGAGNFVYAWQAGVMDGATRALAVNADYNSASETRTLKGYFGFGADIASTDGSILGMICNWAGPGNSHTPQASFQSQVATLASSAMNFSIASGGSKIGYAPTTSCASTTTTFDQDVNHTLAAGEGLGTTNALDVPSGSNTVQQEIVSRGFAMPSLF